MLVPYTIAAGTSCLGWIAITNVAGMTVFAVLYGFFAGAYVSLVPPVIVDLTPEMSILGTWMGMSLFITAFGLLFGNPIVGALVNTPKRRFGAGQGFAGGVVLLGALLLTAAMMLKLRHARSLKTEE